MKHAYSFLAGAALISFCVVATRSLPGYMFLLGCLVTAISNVLLCRVIGFGRIARFFSALDNIRLAPHWSSGASSSWFRTNPRQPSVGTLGSAGRPGEFRVREKQPLCGAPCSVDGMAPTASHIPGVADYRGRRDAKKPAQTSTRCNPSAARNKDNRSVVQSREMLPSVQQDVLSALINLKVPFAHAEEAVHAAAKEHSGQSFDELFRVALAQVNAGMGKTRRAA